MAQDPEPESDRQEEIDPSEDLDMVTLYDSSTVDADIEVDVIRGVLEASGIPSLVQRPIGLPPFGFQLKVPRARQEEARRIIDEARAAGPEAAAEAEAASEEPPR